MGANMGTFNEVALESILSRYEDKMELIRETEIYKWEALRDFKDAWNLDSPNLPEMLKASLLGFAQYLSSPVAYHFISLIELSKYYPNQTKGELQRLSDESCRLDDRIDSFYRSTSRLLKKCLEEHAEDGASLVRRYFPLQAISAYLTLLNPRQHYYYKDEEFQDYLQIIEDERAGAFKSLTADQNSGMAARYRYVTEAYGNLIAFLNKRHPAIIEKSDSLLSPEFAALDPNHHFLAQEIVFSASTYLDRPSWVRSSQKISEKLCQIYEKDLGEESPERLEAELYSTVSKGANKLIEDADPLSFLSAALGTGLPEREKRELFSRTIRLLRISANTPIDFNGIPEITPSELNGSANAREHRLALFLASCRLAKSDTEKARSEFTGAFNRAIRDGGLNAGPLTVALFLSNPSYFLPLDADTCLYFEKKLDIKPPKVISGETYLNYLDLIYRCVPESFASAVYSAQLCKASLSQREAGPESTGKPEKASRPASVKYSRADFLSDVYLDEAQLDIVLGLLNDKRNLILQGAPGTGKTYAARRIAYMLLGNTDRDRVRMVQFHQSTSYDDFVYGYRPTADGGFEPREGTFSEFCRAAREECTEAAREGRDALPYAFIIDEINRANVSKVFGELLMCIEADHRGEEVINPVSRTPFSVPDNVFIIGMMNTADRSLALIDYALRRRFSFFEMRSALENASFRGTLKDSPSMLKLVDAVATLNRTIEDDPSLGRGFEIGHSYFCRNSGTVPDPDRIVEYELAPLLREYWFDNPRKAEKEISRLRESI